MMHKPKTTMIRCVLAAAIGLTTAGYASAQTATGSSQLLTPRHNVKSATQRAPGLWVGQGRNQSNTFIDTALHGFGGATIGPGSDTPGKWAEFQNSAVQAVFDFLNNLADQLVLALSLQKGLSSTGG